MTLAFIECEVTNLPTSDELWIEMEKECDKISQQYVIEEINKIPAIASL